MGQAWWIGPTIAAGAAPGVGLCLASGVIPLNGAGIIPIAGIVIGGAMTSATLTGRRASDELAAQQGAYEAGPAIGLPAVDAANLVGLMAAQAITAALLLRQMAIGRVVRRDLASVHPR